MVKVTCSGSRPIKRQVQGEGGAFTHAGINRDVAAQKMREFARQASPGPVPPHVPGDELIN